MHIAADVRVGDVIQHPAKNWSARRVLRIEDRGTHVRFVLPGIVDAETGVTFPVNARVLIHDVGIR